MKKIRVVAALIADPSDGEKFLVQQRLPGKDRALLWEFPGGKVEAGESDAAALVRECREELAVEVDVGPLVWDVTHRYPDLEVTLLLHRAQIASGTPQPLSCHALQFATPKQMLELPFCEADLPLIRALADGSL